MLPNFALISKEVQESLQNQFPLGQGFVYPAYLKLEPTMLMIPNSIGHSLVIPTPPPRKPLCGWLPNKCLFPDIASPTSYRSGFPISCWVEPMTHVYKARLLSSLLSLIQFFWLTFACLLPTHPFRRSPQKETPRALLAIFSAHHPSSWLSYSKIFY